PRLSKRGLLYTAVLDSHEVIVTASTEPALAAARVLACRAITGKLELWDRTRLAPPMTVDIAVAAAVTVREDRKRPPAFRRWEPFLVAGGRSISADHPHPALTAHSDSTAS